MEPVIERPILPIVPNDPNIPNSLQQWAISLMQALMAILQQHGFVVNNFLGGITELNTGAGWLLARNIITFGISWSAVQGTWAESLNTWDEVIEQPTNTFDSVDPARSMFMPLNIQCSTLSVNGNQVADTNTAVMLEGTQTVTGDKTWTGVVSFDGDIGFFGSEPRTKPIVSGSRDRTWADGSEALNSLLVELSNLGLITNNTTS